MMLLALDVLRGFTAGAAVGAVFALARAQAPAPPTPGGVAGVAGIAAGWALVRALLALRGGG
jgi:XapX domain-containing protein